MPRLSCVVALVLAIIVGPARGEDLAALLTGATAAAHPSATVRGDGELVTTSPDGSVRARVALLQRANGDVYVEVQPPGARALLPVGGNALLSEKPGAAPAAFPNDGALAASEFTREDLQPFDAGRYGSPTIVDRSPAEATVSLDPHGSQYSLVVITFDREKQVPVKVMSYKDTTSNLLRMRREEGHVQVAGRWLPTEISMENFPLKVTSTLTVKWSAAADQPERFDPKTFATAPALIQ